MSITKTPRQQIVDHIIELMATHPKWSAEKAVRRYCKDLPYYIALPDDGKQGLVNLVKRTLQRQHEAQR